MEILLAGGSCRLIDGLIDKFRKEGHRVYVLTGTRYRSAPYHKVFEKYYFPYDSEVLPEIFRSIHPDVVLFLGAYDTVFSWNKDYEKEAVRYQAGLINMLISFSSTGKGRFLYLSSESVYSGHYEENLTELEPASPATTKAMVFSQAEQLCLSYHDHFNLDITVLRLERIYNEPDNWEQARDILSQMCIEAVLTGQITVKENKQIAMLHQDDAIEFIYRMALAESHGSPIYNLSSSEEVSCEQLASIVEEKLNKGALPRNKLEGGNYRRILSNKLYDSEFGMRFFHTLEDSAEKTIHKVQKHPEEYQISGEKRRNLLGRMLDRLAYTIRAMIPFIENMICFIPFFMLNNRAVGSEYFQNLDFYLLYVLLFAIIYGQHQAVFSGVLAVGGYCFRQMYDRSGFEVMLDYNTYIWIAQLFILGLVVGYMRDQIRIIKGEDEQEMDYLSGLLVDIEDINDSNVKVKNALETQILNQNDSIGRLYEITSALEQYSPEEVLFYATEVLTKIIGSQDIAIYLVANRNYARLFTATSQTAKQLGNSINYTTLGILYQTLLEKKVFINKQMDERYPLMANAIYSEDNMQLILMVWGIPWERMTLGQANMLTVVSYLIQNAVIRANRYLEALEENRFLTGTSILEPEAFTSLANAYMTAMSKGLTECTFLRILYQGISMEDASLILKENLRQTDFIGELSDGSLYVLLANSNRESADFVVRRLMIAGLGCEIKEELAV